MSTAALSALSAAERLAVARQTNDTNQDSIARILRVIQGSRITIFSQDRDLQYRWIENPADGFPAETLIGQTDEALLSEPALTLATEQKRKALESRKSRKFELAVLLGGSTRYFEIFVCPEFDAEGKVTGLIGSAIDVSRERQQTQSMAKLILEVSHRSRNLLAIIQSIASQTALSETSIDVYRDRFVGRLHCLSQTQDIITAHDWRGAGIRELADAQLEGTNVYYQTVIDCADIFLAPSAALYVGLAFYELGQHAVRNFAAERSIALGFSETGSALMPVRVSWEERYRTSDQERPLETFAQSVLERLVPQSVDGMADLKVDENRLVYELRIGANAIHDTGL